MMKIEVIRATVRTRLPPALLAAYRATDYVVFFPAGPTRGKTEMRVLRAGESPVWLAACLHAWRTRSGAVLTADNPHSCRFVCPENRRARCRLADALRRRGYRRIFKGENYASRVARSRSEMRAWPVEASFFVPGLTRSEASAWAVRFSQNAFLFVSR
jgi:hypothetical protein